MSKYLKLAIAALAVVLIAIIFAYGYEKGKAKQAAKIAQFIEEKYNALLIERDVKIKFLEDGQAATLVELASVKNEVVKAVNDLAKEKADRKKREDEIRNAPPEVQVTEAQRILKVSPTDIWLTPRSTVEFTLAAFSEASVIFAGYEAFTLKEVPKYEGLIAAQKVETQKNNDLYVGQIKITDEWKGKFNLSEQKFTDYKSNIKGKSAFAKVIDTSLKIAAGIGIGFVLHAVIK